MKSKHIIFVPGKNPTTDEALYCDLIWRTLLEGVRRADGSVAESLQAHYERFHLIDWNSHYYNTRRDITNEIHWINALFNKYGPTKQDIRDANSWKILLSGFLITTGDAIPSLMRLLPKEIQETADEVGPYFNNTNNVASEIRSLIKQSLRPMLERQDEVLLIGHSFGSAIAYDTLWELSNQDSVTGKVDFLTLGSPLGINYVNSRLLGKNVESGNRYPCQIRDWINFSAEGDFIANSGNLEVCFHQMLELGLVKSIEDHCHGIYNFYRSDEGLDCHRAFGYMVNPYIGRAIADWWRLN